MAMLVICSSPGARSQAGRSREDDVRALIQRFADLRNQHDGAAVAGLYSAEGEWIGAAGSVKGRRDLTVLWSGVTGSVTRTVTSIEFPSPLIAVVRVATEYPPPTGRHEELFVLVREADRHEGRNVLAPSDPWQIRLHETL